MSNNNISDIKVIGKRLQELREEKGVSQADIANTLGVKQQTINQWEKGERDIKTGGIIALANYFDVTADYILGIEDCKTHEAADISAATGLTDETILVLSEYYHNQQTVKELNPQYYAIDMDILNKFFQLTLKKHIISDMRICKINLEALYKNNISEHMYIYDFSENTEKSYLADVFSCLSKSKQQLRKFISYHNTIKKHAACKNKLYDILEQCENYDKDKTDLLERELLDEAFTFPSEKELNALIHNLREVAENGDD